MVAFSVVPGNLGVALDDKGDLAGAGPLRTSHARSRSTRVTVGMKTEDAQQVYYASFAVKKHVRGFATKELSCLLDPSQQNGDPASSNNLAPSPALERNRRTNPCNWRHGRPNRQLSLQLSIKVPRTKLETSLMVVNPGT